MSEKRTRLISKLLFLTMCTSLIPTTLAFAEEKDNAQEAIVTSVVQTTGAAVNIDQSDFKFDESTGTIIQYIGNESEVVIPSEINGVKVTNIGDGAFSSSSNLSNCNNITKVTIPDSVISIGDYAFSGCEKLEDVVIPDSVTSIGDYAFLRCNSLSSVTIPDSEVSIGDGAFENCAGLLKITLPNNKISIGDSAFSECTSLQSVNIPDNIVRIGKDAFWVCNNLKEISVGDNNANYKSIDGVLYSKDGTELLEYPNGKSDENYVIVDGVKTIGHNAFYYSSLKSITIPNSVESIDENGFFECINLRSVTIPNSVTSIGKNAFAYCTNLTCVVIPSSVTSISNDSFNGCNDNIILYAENEEVEQLLIQTGISSSRITIGTTIPIDDTNDTTVTLNTTSLNLAEGETSTLTATVVSGVTTSAAVTWETSDLVIATVDQNGNVTGVGVGNAIITCTADDGSGKSAECDVTVTNPMLDRTALNNEISYAQGVAKRLNDAIATAKSVADDDNATEAEINNAAYTLKQKDEELANILREGTVTISNVDGAYLTTVAGTVPTLPSAVDVTFSDGTTTSAAVTWDAAATDPATYSYAGGTNIKGILKDYNNEPVYGYVRIDLEVGEAENNSEIDLSLCGTMMGTGIPVGSIKVFFSLNVTDQEDYTVTVRGKTAVYDETNKQFSVLLKGSNTDFNSFKFIPSDFTVTKN